jgi:hypothetical protein
VSLWFGKGNRLEVTAGGGSASMYVTADFSLLILSRAQGNASASGIKLKPAPSAFSFLQSTQIGATPANADLASELIASGVTTRPIETVTAVLAASRDGASINAAAKAAGINYRTAHRIVAAAAEHRQRQLAAAS